MDTQLSQPILLDGALATNLFELGMPKDACIPNWILQNKQKVFDLQKAFIDAGSKILYTPTFNASRVGLSKFNLQDDIENINRQLVDITKSVVKGTDVKVAGCVSATGLTLEPYGDSSFLELLDIFREQASILVESGVDILVVETLTSIAEARVASIALQKFDIPKYITMSVDEEGETPFGGSAVNALVILQELGISAFGLNCCFGAESMVPQIKAMKQYAKIPIIAKPSACRYDKENNELINLSPLEMAVQMKDIVMAGADIVGGCCQTTPEHIECIDVALKEVDEVILEKPETKGDITLADIRQIYNLYCDNIEFSELLECSVDMTDDILQLEEDSSDVIFVEINTIDDAIDFSKNAHMAKLPVCFSSHEEMPLKLVLMLYNGRAMIDSNTSIDRETLEEISKKYGAVIY